MERKIKLGALLFEFESKDHWVRCAQRYYSRENVNGQNTLALDESGRVCGWGKHFSIAESDRAYPIKVYRLREDEPEVQA